MFASAHRFEVLLFGRFLNGSGTGIITGLASAALYELAPPKARKSAAMIATLAFTGGAAGGPMMTSLAIGAEFYPFVTPFTAIASFAALAFVGLSLSHWPREIESLDPALVAEPSPDFEASVPFTSLFTLACLTVGVAWVIGSVLMALGPSLGLEVYGLASASVAGFIPALFQLFAGVGQYAWGRTSSLKAIAYGTLGIAATQAILMAAAVVENAPLLLLVIPFCGFFYGAAFVGALALVNASGEPERRATYVARFYTVGYLSNALPTLALGLLSDVMGLELTFHLFSMVLIALAVLGTLLASGYRKQIGAAKAYRMEFGCKCNGA